MDAWALAPAQVPRPSAGSSRSEHALSSHSHAACHAQRARDAQYLVQTLHAKTGGHPLRALDRLKSMRLPAMGMAAKSIKPGASPLQRIGQPGQVALSDTAGLPALGYCRDCMEGKQRMLRPCAWQWPA